jgi:putative membrane-bound dehydrogenase-like protein
MDHFHRPIFAILFLVLCLQQGATSTLATEPKTNSKLTLPLADLKPASGLRLELVAGNHLTRWPIAADWDSQGRLVVIESAGVAGNVQEQTVTRPHRMVRLVDDDGDGRFDRRIVAAEQLGFPEGVLCLGDSILVAMPPEIWRFDDLDGDGKCESRSIWFDGKTLTHCANDLHGPYLGIDSWIYWCKGAFAEQQHQTRDGEVLKSKASHIFRRPWAGGPIEAVMTGGMDNPVEVAFSGRGDRFFTSTFLQHPGDGRRDGIAHAVYGGVYGKDHGVLQGHPRTGPLLPIMTHLGPAAPSGLLRLEDHRLVNSLGDSTPHGWLVSSSFNLHQVTAHRLIAQGASYQTEEIPLLQSDRIDFHPTDLLEDADGSLLVIDTGGWYDLCCPSSGVDQEIAQGAIYRLTTAETEMRRQSLPPPTNPQSVEAIEDCRPWIRRLALLQSDEPRRAAWRLRAMDPQTPDPLRLIAFWASADDSPEAIESIPHFLSHEAPSLRHAAALVTGQRRWKQAISTLEKQLRDETDPLALRAMLEAAALLRCGPPETLANLAMEHQEDPMLSHAARFALIRHPQASQWLQPWSAGSPRQQQLALQLLRFQSDAPPPGKALDSLWKQATPGVRKAIIEAMIEHPQWSEGTRSFQADLLTEARHEPPSRLLARELAKAWVNQAGWQQTVGVELNRPNDNSAALEDWLLEIVLAERPLSLPDDWALSIARSFPKLSMELQDRVVQWYQGIGTRSNQATQLDQAIAELNVSTQDPIRRFQQIAATSMGSITWNASVGQEVQQAVLAGTPAQQAAALQAMAKIPWGQAQVDSWIEQWSQIPQLSWSRCFPVLWASANEQQRLALLDRIESTPLELLGLSPADLLSQAPKDQTSVRQKIERLIEAQRQGKATIQEEVAVKLKSLPEGDRLRGLQVFRSTQAGCSGCHAIGYVGGKIGPELSRIGSTRSKEDILEAILYPSARLEQGYRTVRILTTDGQLYQGLPVRQDSQTIELLLQVDRSVRVDTESIETMQPGEISVMPAGIERLLSPQQLADLLELLQQAK